MSSPEAARRRRTLRFLALVSSIDRFVLPPMILAISRDLGIPFADVAAAAGAYFLAYGLTQPVWGMIGARIGVVRLLRITCLLATVATLASTLAFDTASLVAVRVLAGIGFGNALPSALYYAGTTAAPGERHREITGLMAGVALGTSTASAGAGIVAGTIGWRVAFLVSGVAGLALWVLVRRLPELPTARAATRGTLGPLFAVLRNGPARMLLVLALVEGAILLGTLTFLPAAAEEAGSGPALAGVVTAAFGMSMLVCAPLVGRLQRRVPPGVLIATGASCATLGCTLAAVSVRPWVVALVCALIGAAWAAMHSTLQTWATEVAPQAGVAAVSLFAGCLFAGSALATLIGRQPADDGRFAVIFATGAMLAIPLGIAGTVARSRWRRHVEPT